MKLSYQWPSLITAGLRSKYMSERPIPDRILQFGEKKGLDKAVPCSWKAGNSKLIDDHNQSVGNGMESQNLVTVIIWNRLVTYNIESFQDCIGLSNLRFPTIKQARTAG